MKPKHRKQLSLNRETIRTLNPDELSRVDGGRILTIPGVSETSCSCNGSCSVCSFITCPSASNCPTK